MIMNQDTQVLRALAMEYREIMHHERNAQNVKLHSAVNDLHQIRPIVLIDEVPWHEMNFDGFLALQCQDPYLQTVEQKLRRIIYQWKYFPADMVVPNYIGVTKVVHSGGIGVEVKEETQRTASDNNVVSHKYENQFTCEEDLDKLHFDALVYDEVETKRRYELLSNMIGDIVPVRIVGISSGYANGCITWDIISNFMGVNDLLYNLIDEEDFMHAMVAKLTDIFLDRVRQYEALNLFDADAYSVHCASAISEDLKKNPYDPAHVTAKNVWGRGLAQILDTVSPQMHQEFDIDYMVKAMAPFGLVYYGCCEALDKKVDILKKIPNLRKICMSPWTNIDIGAAAIGKDYVLSAKPSPATLAFASFNEQVVHAEIGHILDASVRNSCSTELLLKDISTTAYHPENIFAWEKIAMQHVKNL